jgi:hypothetical protein
MYPKTTKECSVDECEKLALINTRDIVCSEHLFSDLNESEND